MPVLDDLKLVTESRGIKRFQLTDTKLIKPVSITATK